MSRHSSRQHRILAILMLLGLLFQVQTVLACQMMGTTTVSAEHCCCDDVEASKTATEEPHAEKDSCCALDTEFSLKEPDLEKELPALVQSPTAVELPETVVLALLVAIWQDDFLDSSPRALWDDPPQSGLPGNKTYLSTQRLRI